MRAFGMQLCFLIDHIKSLNDPFPSSSSNIYTNTCNIYKYFTNEASINARRYRLNTNYITKLDARKVLVIQQQQRPDAWISHLLASMHNPYHTNMAVILFTVT